MEIDEFMRRLAGVESGNPTAVNPDSGAYGTYQIMPDNWGPWSREAGLGANAPRTAANQQRVAKFKLQQYYNTFKNWGAVAAAWYGGPGAAQRYLKNPNDPYLSRKQGGGKYPSINEYIRRVTGGAAAATSGVRSAVNQVVKPLKDDPTVPVQDLHDVNVQLANLYTLFTMPVGMTDQVEEAPVERF